MFSVHWSPCFQAIPLSTLIPGERTWFIEWITLLKKFSENRQFLWHTLVDIVIHTTILQDINTVWIVIDWKLQGPRRTCEIWQLLPSGTLHSWFVTSTPFLICPNMADCKPYRIQCESWFTDVQLWPVFHRFIGLFLFLVSTQTFWHRHLWGENCSENDDIKNFI